MISYHWAAQWPKPVSVSYQRGAVVCGPWIPTFAGMDELKCPFRCKLCPVPRYENEIQKNKQLFYPER